MPGLGVRSQNKTYLGFFQGMMTRNVSEGTENAIKRTKKSGKEVYEIQFNTLGGNFTDIKVTEDDDNRKYWVFVMEWEGKEWELSVGYTSVAAKGVLSRLKNMDFSKTIEFRSFWIEGDDDIYRGFLTPYLDGHSKAITPFYTREDPKDLPPPVPVTISGQEHMDYTAQMEFYQEMVIGEILPKMRKAHPLSESAVNEPEQSPFTESAAGPGGELTPEARQENRDNAQQKLEDQGKPGADDEPPPDPDPLPF